MHLIISNLGHLYSFATLMACTHTHNRAHKHTPMGKRHNYTSMLSHLYTALTLTLVEWSFCNLPIPKAKQNNKKKQKAKTPTLLSSMANRKGPMIPSFPWDLRRKQNPNPDQNKTKQIQKRPKEWHQRRSFRYGIRLHEIFMWVWNCSHRFLTAHPQLRETITTCLIIDVFLFETESKLAWP